MNKPTLKSVEPTIKQTLLGQAQDTLWGDWLSKLADQYKGKVSYQSGYAPPTTSSVSNTIATTG